MVEHTGAPERESIPDKVLMYACIFTYEKPRVRAEILNYQVNYEAISSYESSNQLPGNSSQTIQNFESLGHEEQREYLDARENAEAVMTLFRTLLSIVNKVSSDPQLTRWALALLNGIIEDRRDRIRHLAQI